MVETDHTVTSLVNVALSPVKQRRDITSVQTVSCGGGIEFRLTFPITGGIHRSAANKQQSKY